MFESKGYLCLRLHNCRLCEARVFDKPGLRYLLRRQQTFWLTFNFIALSAALASLSGSLVLSRLSLDGCNMLCNVDWSLVPSPLCNGHQKKKKKKKKKIINKIIHFPILSARFCFEDNLFRRLWDPASGSVMRLKLVIRFIQRPFGKNQLVSICRSLLTFLLLFFGGGGL